MRVSIPYYGVTWSNSRVRQKSLPSSFMLHRSRFPQRQGPTHPRSLYRSIILAPTRWALTRNDLGPVSLVAGAHMNHRPLNSNLSRTLGHAVQFPLVLPCSKFLMRDACEAENTILILLILDDLYLQYSVLVLKEMACIDKEMYTSNIIVVTRIHIPSTNLIHVVHHFVQCNYWLLQGKNEPTQGPRPSASISMTFW